MDSAISITNILLRLATTCECNTSNISFMARHKLSIVLLRCLAIYHQEINFNHKGSVMLPNFSQKLNDILVNIYTLLIKLSKYGKSDLIEINDNFNSKI